MSLSNSSIAAASGVLIVSAYLVEPTSVPFIAAGVVATWVRHFTKKRSPRTPPLDPKDYHKFTLVDKIVFALPHEDDVLNLPIGQHVSIMATIGGKEILRSYTPTSNSDDIGHFSYPQGNISKLFGELSIGDYINARGPKGQFNYTPNMCRAIGMIAGGTGLTPMLQIIRAIVKNPADKTKVNLIFANVTEQDILLKAELDALAAKHPQFNVHYVLNTPPEGWTGGVGFVNAEMIKEYMPAPAGDIKVLLCGPPPMITVMSKITQELGYDKVNAVSKLPDQVFKF
ncbi:NADH-cytochrome b5 reductase [Mortierella sp. AM989]|nr:NADH-cytochrome b5 reductase [Mortierella sp. AM989]